MTDQVLGAYVVVEGDQTSEVSVGPGTVTGFP
jgi:hypothetical protein